MAKKKKEECSPLQSVACEPVKWSRRPERFQLYKHYRFVEGMDRYNAAIKAGFAKSTAAQSTRVLENRVPFADFMRRAGLTDEFLASKIKEGFEANKVISAKIIVGKGEREADSQTDDFIEVPDHNARHKYLETALKCKGKLNTETQVSATTINLSLAIDGQAQPVVEPIDITAQAVSTEIAITTTQDGSCQR